MKKVLLSLALVMFFGLLMTSCGGDKKKSTTESSAKAETQTAQAAKKEEAKQTANTDYTKWKPDLTNGKKVYADKCIACHLTGVSNAPALKPDKYKKEDWQKRADKGINALMQSAIHGVPGTAMTAKGTCTECTEKDLFDAIHYMYNEAKTPVTK